MVSHWGGFGVLGLAPSRDIAESTCTRHLQNDWQVRWVDQTQYQPWHSPLRWTTSYAHGVAPLRYTTSMLASSW